MAELVARLTQTEPAHRTLWGPSALSRAKRSIG